MNSLVDYRSTIFQLRTAEFLEKEEISKDYGIQKRILGTERDKNYYEEKDGNKRTKYTQVAIDMKRKSRSELKELQSF